MYRFWLILCLSNVAVPIATSNCPEIKGCSSCSPIGANQFIHECPSTANRQFVTVTDPDKAPTTIGITCLFPATLSDFNVSVSSKSMKYLKELYLIDCPLLKTKPLVKILGQFSLKKLRTLLIKNWRTFNSTIEAVHFSKLPKLESLTFDGLCPNEFNGNLIKDLLKLRTLSIQRTNCHVNFSANFFRHGSRISHYGLMNLSLEYLPIGMFNNMNSVSVLWLSNNKITDLGNGTFDNLTKLRVLDLYYNKIRRIETNAFVNNKRLYNLQLGIDSSARIHGNIFENNMELVSLIIKVHSGRSLGYASISADALRNLRKLDHLELTGIEIEDLNQVTFRNLTVLTVLKLESNNIQSLPDGIFQSNNALSDIQVISNHLKTISDKTFSGLTELKAMDLESNQIEHIDPLAFQDMDFLEYISLIDNKLSSGNGFFNVLEVFRYRHYLKRILLDRNRIEKLHLDLVIELENLRFLSVTENNATVLGITYGNTNRRQNLTVDVSTNIITEVVDVNNSPLISCVVSSITYANGISFGPENFIKIIMSSNPLSCNCMFINKLRGYEILMADCVSMHFLVGAEDCQVFSSEVTTIRPKSGSENERCPVKTEDCPVKCQFCWRRPKDSVFEIDCAFGNLHDLPVLPRLVNEFIELNLTGNVLTKIPSSSQHGYDKVSKLFLGHNRISEIDIDDLSPNWQVLELHNNRLEQASSERLLNHTSELPKLKELTLRGNIWPCSCPNGNCFHSVSKFKSKFEDLKNIDCNNAPKAQLEIIIPVVICSICAVVICAFVVVYFRYTISIKSWLYAHRCCLLFVTEKVLDQDERYDAFISYSSADEEYVANVLIPKLEEQPWSLKVCIHHRDWVPGDVISDQIARSVEDSKRTIIVLSSSYLKSTWGMMEFRLAHRKGLETKRPRLIVILYGDVDVSSIDDVELKAYLQTYTYVRWDDRRFWNKIKYALPHLSKASRH